MSRNGVVTIGRQELYERVWATPMRTPAAEFRVNDVGPAGGRNVMVKCDLRTD